MTCIVVGMTCRVAGRLYLHPSKAFILRNTSTKCEQFNADVFLPVNWPIQDADECFSGPPNKMMLLPEREVFAVYDTAGVKIAEVHVDEMIGRFCAKNASD